MMRRASLLPSHPLYIGIQRPGGHSVRFDHVQQLILYSRKASVTAYDSMENKVVWKKDHWNTQIAFNSRGNVVVRSDVTLTVYQDSTLLVTIAGPIDIWSCSWGRVAIDGEDNIYWADYDNNQILIYSQELVLIKALQVIDGPHALFIHNKRLYVGSMLNSMMHVYTLEGVFEFRFKVLKANHVSDILITKQKHLIVTSDAGIDIFDAANGSILLSYPKHSFGIKEQFSPLSIATIPYGQSGNISKLIVSIGTLTDKHRPCICLRLYSRPAVAWIYSPLSSFIFSDVEIVV